jgi:hypothetical protein
LGAVNSQAESFALEAAMERSRNKQRKVKRLGKTVLSEDGFPFIFYQFMKEWECIDEQKLRGALERLDAMGIGNSLVQGEE